MFPIGDGKVSLNLADESTFTMALGVRGIDRAAVPADLHTSGARRDDPAALGEFAGVLLVGDRGCAVLTFPPFNCELGEVTEIAGTKGRIMLGQPGHCPTNVTIRVPPRGGIPSRYRTRNAASPEERFDYPLPGNVAMAPAFPNQHGFLYQAEAVHRCLAADLRECPQYGKAESVHAMDLLTRIQLARRRPGGPKAGFV